MVADPLESTLLEPLPTDHAGVSTFVRDLRSDAILAAHAPDRPLPPASNTKLITTAIGLDRLGPDYRFQTRVHATSDPDGKPLDDGHLDGDIILEGSGAPDLSVADLRTLAEHVREAGVRTVAGDLLLDDSWFDAREFAPGWCVDDPRHGYGAPSTALALERNVVEISVTSQDGDVAARVEPDSGVVDVALDVAIDDETDLSAETDPASGVVTVAGTIAAGDSETVSAPVASPLTHCGVAFRSALAEAGVTVQGEVRVGRTAEWTTAVATHQSEPLAAVCREMNVPSDNFVAETIARTIAVETADEGTWDAWEDIVGDFLDDLGVEGHRVRDGSGLSRYNHVPARGFVELVEWAIEQPWSKAFLTSLPVAGEDGTLEGRLGDLDATIRAKTGSLTGTRTLSGVIEDESEPAIVFSIQLSNLVDELEDEGRNLQDRVIRRVVETVVSR